MFLFSRSIQMICHYFQDFFVTLFWILWNSLRNSVCFIFVEKKNILMDMISDIF